MKRHHIILFIILLIGLFFRTYQIVERFEFAHDGDLYSWIVKDIVVNHHFRLIGQETSAPGIFIGPLFYYMLVPSFIISNMDPIGSTFLVTLIGVLTIASFYFVFSKLFNDDIGLISGFLYAVLLTPVSSDRWVVPTVTTSLWGVWYFYTLLMIARGKLKYFPLLGILIGLIWHIHIALIPSLIAVPVAIIISKKLPNLKQFLYFALTLFITAIPLVIFEAKHQFTQTLSIINNFGYKQEGGPEGLYRFQLVLSLLTKNLNSLLFAPQSFNITQNIFFTILFLLTPIFLIRRKILSSKELIPIYAWMLGTIIFFSVSGSPISEYYFAAVGVIFIAFTALLLYFLFTKSNKGKIMVFLLLGIVLIKNLHFLITQEFYHKGYVEKKKVVNYIVSDANSKNFPCFSINYITSLGENVGFRYFFFLKNAQLAVPGRGSPVYSIVIPDEYALKEVGVKFGHIGIITPKEVASQKIVKESCSGQNTNLTDPMFGYVE